MNDNRINQLTVATTGTRQTPKNEFGEVLVQTSKEALGVGAALVGSITGGPIMTAAVSGVSTVLGMASRSAAPGAQNPGDATRQTQTIAGGNGGGSTGATGGGSGSSDAIEALEMQAALQAEGFKMNAMYMGIQREMQRESREFTTVTNIMKVRHDTAKSAINNVR